MSTNHVESPSNVPCSKSVATFKLLFFGITGLIIFFAPCINGQTPLSELIKFTKTALGGFLSYFIVATTVMLMVCSWFAKKVPFLWRFMSKDGIATKVLYVLGSIFGIMVLFQVGPAELVQNKNTGPLALYLAYTVMITVLLAGVIVCFITNFGLLQFCGTLMEPIMRPVYKLPGYAALDSAIAIVCSAAVGVFEVNKNYTNKLYTQKEAGLMVTNFTIHSLGFFVVLCELSGIPTYYTSVTLASIGISFILPLATLRLPPISSMSNLMHDNTPYVGDTVVHHDKNILSRAWEAAVTTSQTSSVNSIAQGFVEAFTFSLKIASYVLAIATIAMWIGEYTNFWVYIGKPMVPVLEFFGIPNAVEVGPTVIVGITEIAMPAVLIAGKGVAPAAAWFVVVLCTVQIVSFTESANAIMESDIPLGFWQLVLVFIVRTVLAIPLTAAAMHLCFSVLEL